MSSKDNNNNKINYKNYEDNKNCDRTCGYGIEHVCR